MQSYTMVLHSCFMTSCLQCMELDYTAECSGLYLCRCAALSFGYICMRLLWTFKLYLSQNNLPPAHTTGSMGGGGATYFKVKCLALGSRVSRGAQENLLRKYCELH